MQQPRYSHHLARPEETTRIPRHITGKSIGGRTSTRSMNRKDACCRQALSPQPCPPATDQSTSGGYRPPRGPLEIRTPKPHARVKIEIHNYRHYSEENAQVDTTQNGSVLGELDAGRTLGDSNAMRCDAIHDFVTVRDGRHHTGKQQKYT